MKIKNNKGFTLVELLAVLVILLTILTIAIPSITSSIDRHKEKVLNKKIDIIEVAAETFVDQYKNIIDYSKLIDGLADSDDIEIEYGSCCINIDDIKEQGILTEEDLLDANENPIPGYVCYDKTKKEYIYDREYSGSEC